MAEQDPYVVAQRRIESDLAQGWDGWDAGQEAFLRAHRWATLATGRKDGSPQVSMVGYGLDDQGRLLISAKTYTAKYHNAVRLPKVAVLVHEGRQEFVVYGTAETFDADPERAEIDSQLRRSMGADPGTPDEQRARLDLEQRCFLRVTPTAAVYRE